jgi:transcriptional regulator with XRE-family HTH domain
MTPDEFRDARRMLGRKIGQDDLSQRDLAQALGISSARAIRHYEDGTRPIGPTVELLMRYMMKYGLPHVALRNEGGR